jgi:hypothetical protein
MPVASPAEPERLPPRARRSRLDSLDRVRREAVRLYREGRDGARPTGDVHRLAATLAIVGRLIEGGRP